MTKERNRLKAGSFIVVSFVLIFAVIAGIRGLRSFIEPTRLRTVTFRLADDVGGLRVGDDVRVGGFKVGNVRGITIDGGDEAEPVIAIEFSLPTKYAVRHGYRVRIQTAVTNTSVLNFESLGAGEAIPDDQALVGMPSSFTETIADLRGIVGDVRGRLVPSIQETATKFGKTADAVASASFEVEQLATEVRDDAKPVLDKYGRAADRATEMMTQIRDVFGEGKGDLKGTFANMNAVTGSLKERLPGMLTQLSAAIDKLSTSIASADGALKEIRQASSNIKDAGQEIRSILVGNRSKIDGLIASLKTTSDNLKNASAEIRRSPWRLLYKPDEAEAANLNLFDAARQFAQGAADLNDAAEALRDAARDKQATPEQVKKLMERLDASFAKFSEMEKVLWSSVRE